MQDIERLFRDYAAAWHANDPARIAGFWDPDDDRPLYKAEEVPDFLTRRDELLAYWRGNAGMHERIELEFRDFVFKPVGDGHAMAVCRMRWDILFSPTALGPDGAPLQWRGQAMGGDNHVVALLRRTAAGWRFAAWSETPPAPLVYVGELYLRNVKPGFVAGA